VALWHLGGFSASERKLPGKAIPFYYEALARLDGDACLQQGALYLSLSAAYAQEKEEKVRALELLEQAKETMPEHLERDPLARLMDIGPAEFDRHIGQFYLELHKHFPTEGYAKSAHGAFEEGTRKPAFSKRARSEILIGKADAARHMGDLHEYLKCLEQGTHIALSIRSQKRVSEAIALLQKAPRAWRNEQKYQNLAQLFEPGRG
jgi:hypothetical protein